MPNGVDKKLNFTPKIWDSIAGAYKPFYIAPDATNVIQGDVKLSDATDNSTLDAATGMTAATPKAVNTVKQATDNKLDKVISSDQTVASKVTFNNAVVLSKGATVASGQIIIGNLQGNSTTATTLQTSRMINLSGRITGSASFNGGADATIATVIPEKSIVSADLADMSISTEKLANKAVTNEKINFNYASSSSQGGNADAALKVIGQSLSNEDLNNLKEEGKIYYAMMGNNCTNKPDGIDNFGLISWKISDEHYGQLLQNENSLYIRFFNASSWSIWKEIGYIENGSITTEKLADNSVTTEKIADGAIKLIDLNANEIGTVCINSEEPIGDPVQLWIQP